jgi:hypothetical protein
MELLSGSPGSNVVVKGKRGGSPWSVELARGTGAGGRKVKFLLLPFVVLSCAVLCFVVLCCVVLCCVVLCKSRGRGVESLWGVIICGSCSRGLSCSFALKVYMHGVRADADLCP